MLEWNNSALGFIVVNSWWEGHRKGGIGFGQFFFYFWKSESKKKFLLKMSDNKFYKCGNLRPDDQKSNTMLSIKIFFLYISSLVLLFLSIGLFITMIKRSMHIKVQKEIQFLLFIKVNKTNLFYLVYYCSGYFWHSCWILKSSVMYFYKNFQRGNLLEPRWLNHR